MEILYVVALHCIFLHTFFSMGSARSELELTSVDYYDRDNQLRPHILAEGYITFKCRCPSGRVVLVLNNKTELGYHGCFDDAEYRFQQHLSATTLGEYRCLIASGPRISNKSAVLNYKICDPRSQACHTKCETKQPSFCVVTENHPTGKSCVTTLEAENSFFGSFWPVYYCPNGATSFGKALAEGLQNVFAVSNQECPQKDEIYYFYFDDKKLHYMEVVQVKDRKSIFKILCPTSGAKAQAKLYYIVASGNRNLTIEDDRYMKEGCFGIYPLSRVTHFTEQHAPYRLQTFLMLGSDQREYQTRNYFVIFMDKLRLSGVKIGSRGMGIVRIKMPNYLDPEFTVNVTASLLDDQGKRFNLNVNDSYEIIVPSTGRLKVTMTQHYRSCAPYADFEAPVLVQEFIVREDRIDAYVEEELFTIPPMPSPFAPWIILVIVICVFVAGAIGYFVPEIKTLAKAHSVADKTASNEKLRSQKSLVVASGRKKSECVITKRRSTSPKKSKISKSQKSRNSSQKQTSRQN